ncbi:HNH endonuclease [Phaeospirillum tilakii]|uniref:HNH endonuclease n=1 Tax=Phaeospirillum tilakii TaxID=741673 RepID=A0ABW5CA10_9PROT
MTPENPPGFVVRTEAQKAAFDNGFRLERGITGGWLGFASTTVQGDIWIAGISKHGPWLLALEHTGVIAELTDLSRAVGVPSPGAAAFLLPTTTSLDAALNHVYRLASSLPDLPLRQFKARTMSLPQSTEAERLVIQRVGQDIFRAALIEYWGGRCPLSGVTDGRLLRASHIKPWAACETDAERLDVHNGLLLAAHLDAAFDAGLISFADDGTILFAATFSLADRTALAIDEGWTLPGITFDHQRYLAWHRCLHLAEPKR